MGFVAFMYNSYLSWLMSVCTGMHESNPNVRVLFMVVMLQHCTERNTKLRNPEGAKSSFLFCWSPFRVTSLEIGAKKKLAHSASVRCCHVVSQGLRQMCVCVCVCVCICACSHLLLNIQRDSTRTLKRQLRFQICTQVHEVDFYLRSKLLLDQSIFRNFIMVYFYRSRPLAVTWARRIHSTPFNTVIRTENPTRCHSVSKFYSIFIWSSTCFWRHTAHHQEPKTALAASGFAYVEGCWTCIKILFHIYMKLNMFRATHRPSSGA
jgi:hypothetical protein